MWMPLTCKEGNSLVSKYIIIIKTKQWGFFVAWLRFCSRIWSLINGCVSHILTLVSFENDRMSSHRACNVQTKSMQHHDVAATLLRCCINIMCSPSRHTTLKQRRLNVDSTSNVLTLNQRCLSAWRWEFWDAILRAHNVYTLPHSDVLINAMCPLGNINRCNHIIPDDKKSTNITSLTSSPPVWAAANASKSIACSFVLLPLQWERRTKITLTAFLRHRKTEMRNKQW